MVNKISINSDGSALLLAGSDGLCVMYLYGRNVTEDRTTICRTLLIGADIYFTSSNIIRTLQFSWHPSSPTHVGVLSSDSVFRLFDLSSSLEQPEQEYYLQPVEPGRCKNAASICPADFFFGGDHLWDRFSVFVLFTDGSVYVLCPIVPFGSVYKWDAILEIYNDAQTFGLKSPNPRAVSNSNMALSWMEATFPELNHQAAGGNPLYLKSQPHILFDASISLQGPLPKLSRGGEKDTEVQGRAFSLLYKSVSKDSILVTAWSGGQLQIDALADEIQPVWFSGNPPRVRVDSYDHISGVAMICEPIPGNNSILKLDQPPHHVWSGYPPPLLRLAIVDLALPRNKEKNSIISMFSDPLVPERIYSLHDGGIDAIVLHFLPFSSQANGIDESMRTPSVHPVLSNPLAGFVSMSDSFGYSWILGLTSSRQGIVFEMKTWDLLLQVHANMEKNDLSLEDSGNRDASPIISKELLAGPKPVFLPSAPNLLSVTADSIEGRSTLHQYFNMFHENYAEYAHKVFVELKNLGPHLKKIIEIEHGRLREVQQKLLKVEEVQGKIEYRISRTTQQHKILEKRLQNLRNLPGVHKKPLSKAEKELKSELDRFSGVELDALRSSIETLNARLKRYTHLAKGNMSNQPRQLSHRRKSYVQDDDVSRLKSSLEKLSLVNTENTKKVKVLESALSRASS